ncbi:DUF7239 family protein [Microbacterium allomyrinae]|uniref:Uncharacterized protein n=1 Tax=Microbacterium allomyrinae TaxID=2830666 RepID=A0A9X1LWP5_9MICO|nr:hypothetical protein [Microbacterium allomyrinae]MCC2033081.1 hypothetical protein [Microbacterium allomyrinae]
MTAEDARQIDGHDESKLPKWAQARLRNLRRKIERLTVETVRSDDVPADVRVMIARSTQNERYTTEWTAIPLADNDRVIFMVTGGRMEVELRKFGSRYRLGIVGHGDYDRLLDARPDIAILPAMGNVVEAAFVMQAPDAIVMEELLAIEPAQRAVTHPAEPPSAFERSFAALQEFGYPDGSR